MTHDEVVEKLLHWMTTFVEVPHPALGNFPPCPYARQARVNNKIEVIAARFGNLVNTINDNLQLLDHKDVIVFWFNHNDVDPATLSTLVKAYNKIVMPCDYVVLEDHPDALEFVSGANMNFGYCGLLLVSKLSKLNAAATQLRAKGYYHQWDSQALEEVVNWRFE
jgi:hypothetical protein